MVIILSFLDTHKLRTRVSFFVLIRQHSITPLCKLGCKERDNVFCNLQLVMTVLFLSVEPTSNINQQLWNIIMPKHFYKNIKLYVYQEITFAKKATKVRKQATCVLSFNI